MTQSSGIQSYRDLRVWQEAMVLAEECYKLSHGFPREEAFGMTSQIRRAGVSIAANIAEGHGRETTGSFVQFLRIAQGSLKEIETLLLLSTRVEIVKVESVTHLLDRCDNLGKMLRALVRSLQKGAQNA